MNSETPQSPQRGSRFALAREAFVLQLKLVADGFRDALLIPISLVAAVIGLIRGGAEADREFREVLRLGRRTERWINLFGYHRPYSRSHPAGSMDTLVDKIEDVIREQYEKGKATQEDMDAIEHALEDLQGSSKKKPGSEEQGSEK